MQLGPAMANLRRRCGGREGGLQCFALRSKVQLPNMRRLMSVIGGKPGPFMSVAPLGWRRRVVWDQTVTADVNAHRAAGNCGEVDHHGLEAPRAEVTRLAGELKRSLPKGSLVRHLAAFETE